MVLMRLGLALSVFFTAIAGTLGAAIWAYVIGSKAGLKGDAEQILFYGLIITVLELGGFIALMVQGQRKRRELEKFSELVRYGGTISSERLGSFGPLGVQLDAILKELSDASDRKSVRIASLTGLLRAVMDLMERSLVVVELDGRVVAASRPVTEADAFSELKIGESRISEFLPEADLRVVLEEADRTHATVERKEHLSFIPVFSVSGEITHFLVDLGKKGAKDLITSMIQTTRAGLMRKTEPGKDGDTRGGLFRAIKDRLTKGKKHPPADSNPDVDAPQA
ncbi:MAG: hypothetical protein E4H20_10555 [Spirochaetales bacterium]|nr:MAG: hypothetical protein E4H20_10555 [Spirochaetales bacterium]